MKRVFASSVALLLAIGASSLFLSASSVVVPSGTWAPTGDLAETRAGSAAVLLSDGVVLITGGSGPDGRSASAERYSAAGGTFIPTASMHTARANHTAISLNDGRVLVIGGFGADGGVIGGAEIYDPATNAWAPAGTLVHARAAHTATLLPDGRVLVAGGENGDGALATLEVYLPVFEEFVLVATPMTTARMRHAAALAGERVLIMGGWDGAAALASVDVYEPATDSVAAGPAMLDTRAEHTATTLLSGNVLVAGGMNAQGDLQTAEVFDAVAGGFVATANAMSTARRNHIAILLPHNNSVLIAGGSSNGAASATAELYRAWQDGGIFVSTGSSGAARNWSAGSALSFAASATNRSGPADGLVLVAGGEGASSAELYGFATVKTDKDDYLPGMTVRVSGSGWQPNQSVTFYLRELPAEHYARLFTIDADGSGNIEWTDLFLVEQHHLGVHFLLTAGDGVSQAQTTFTDGNVDISGSVKSSATGNPAIQNATVTCTSGCNSGDPATTNASGNYTNKFNFSGNDPVTITLTASATGFVSKSVTLTVSNTPSPPPVNFVLDPAVTNRTLTITGTGAGTGTVASDIGSINCSIANGIATGTCSASIADGELVTLTADPSTTLPTAAGSTFNGWSGDGTGTTTRSVTMDANKSVNAHFKANQTITVTPNAPSSAVYDTTFNVAATASSSLDVAITISGVCAIDSGGNNSAVVKMTSGTGTCTVHYNQAGNANYNAASEVTEGVTAQKASQTITVTATAPSSSVFDTTFSVAATASSGLDVAITVSGVCALDNGGTNTAVVRMTSGTGTCTIHYNQAGDANYSAASEATEGVTAQKASQTITVTTNAPASAMYDTTFTVAATASSGLNVAITASGACAIDSGGTNSAVVKMTSGTGTCTVQYNQPGNANYNAASEVTENVTAQKANQTITVTTNAPPSAMYDTTFTVTATASSGLDVAITVSGVCTLDSGGINTAVVRMTSGTGTCTVHYNQAGNANYNAASEVTEGVTAQKANQTITVTTNAPESAVYASTSTVAATASTGLDVAITASGACAIDSGGTITAVVKMTSGTGTCTVHYNQAGNDNFNAAPQVSQNVTAQKVLLTITASSHTITFNDPIPTITPGYAGFVAGDDAGDLITQPTCSTTYTVGALIGTYTSKCELAASNNYSFSYVDGNVTVLTACSTFNGFLSPIGGAVENNETGGSFINPVRAFRLNSTIPVKFNATCFGAPLTTGTHTLQATKFSNSTSFDLPIDATPTDAATTGNQFRLTGTEWHFNLSTKVGMSQGIWLLKGTLFDGSTYSVWVEIKK